MANTQNLKPFKKGYDPRRNTKGVPTSIISKCLREIGDSKAVSFFIEITQADGTKKKIRGKFQDGNKDGSINMVIAAQLAMKAVKGDLKAIREYVDRTEGKPKQALEIDKLPLNGTIKVGYCDEKQK